MIIVIYLQRFKLFRVDGRATAMKSSKQHESHDITALCQTSTRDYSMTATSEFSLVYKNIFIKLITKFYVNVVFCVIVVYNKFIMLMCACFIIITLFTHRGSR